MKKLESYLEAAICASPLIIVVAILAATSCKKDSKEDATGTDGAPGVAKSINSDERCVYHHRDQMAYCLIAEEPFICDNEACLPLRCGTAPSALQPEAQSEPK